MGQEWFQAVQSVMGLCELLIQSGQISFSLFQDESVILRIDFEKHVAFLCRLVVLHIQLEDLTTDTRRNPHGIGSHCRIIGSRMPFDDSPDVKGDEDRAGDDDYGCDLANELALFSAIVRWRHSVLLFQRGVGLMHLSFDKKESRSQT